jgi:hypothetical protein
MEFEKRLNSLRDSSPPLEPRLFDETSAQRPESVTFKFMCPCKICYLETSEKYQLSIQKPIPKPAHKNTSKGYTWLLEKLGEISVDQAIKLNVPDVVVFRHSTPVFYVQQTRDRSIKYIKAEDKLRIQEVIKAISMSSRTRKREELNSMNKIMLSGTLTEFGKDIACVRYMKAGVLNDLEQIMSSDEDGALRVMNDNEFMGLMWQRPSSLLWKSIAYMQSILKCKNSIGESFIYFYSFQGIKLNDALDAGLNENEDLENALYLNDRNKYCEFIFKKIFYLLEKFANIRLKSMQGEFLRDENNRIWLIHCSSIEIDCIVQSLVTNSAPTIASSFESITKKELIKYLELSSKEIKNSRTEKIAQMMKEECDKMITAYNIKDLFANVKFEKDNIAAFSRLRPSTPNEMSLMKTKQTESAMRRVGSEQKRKKVDDLMLTPSPKKESMIKTSNSWIYKPKFKISPIKSIRKIGWSPNQMKQL